MGSPTKGIGVDEVGLALALVNRSMASWLSTLLVVSSLVDPPSSEQGNPSQDDPPSKRVAFDHCKRGDPQERFRITLPREVELEALVDWMMSISCRNFIWDPRLRHGKATLIAPEPVSLAEAEATFHAALNTMGLTVEPSGEFFRIIEAQDVHTKDLPIYGPGASVPGDDRFVTKVLRPGAGRLDEVVSLLGELKTSRGKVQTVGQAVILTDTGHRIRQLLRLIEQVEAPEHAERRIHLYGVRHSEAEALAEVIRNVFQTKTPTSAPRTRPRTKDKTPSPSPASPTSEDGEAPTILVDSRTGTLIVLTSSAGWGPIRRLIEELDVPEQGGRSTLHVIELEHADAQEVETVLTKLASGGQEAKRDEKAKTTPAALGSMVTGDVRVTAHPASQTLIVSASHSDFQALRRVVDTIDRPRRQLYIEVYLLEVRSNRYMGGGVGGHVGGAKNGNTGFVSSSPGGQSVLNLGSSEGASALLGGLTAAVIGQPLAGTSSLFPGLGVDLPSFGVVLQALETRDDVNVVADPHVYAAENEKATVEFGESVPVQGSTTTIPGGGVGTLQSINRERVTLKIEIEPHVNDDETVTLDVLLEDRQLGAEVSNLNSFRTTERKLDLKKVIAHPGQPVVLGGMVREVEKASTKQVPGLGSIPVLGWLFKSKSRDREKVTLLMVMVPHLVDSPDDARRVLARRMQERMEFLQRYTAFERRDLDLHVNYRKKSGLLSAIDAEARRRQREARFVERARDELEQQPIEAEFGLHADPDGRTDAADAADDHPASTPESLVGSRGPAANSLPPPGAVPAG